MEHVIAFPFLRSPSYTENSMSWLFMSAMRFGTPVCACTSEYGRSPQRPIAYSNFLSSPRSLPATAKPAATAPAATTHSRTTETLRFDMLPPRGRCQRDPLARGPARGYQPDGRVVMIRLRGSRRVTRGDRHVAGV